jgi:hypothetical protein
VEEDDSGILVVVLSMGVSDKLGRRFKGGKVSGIEVRVGLTTGVDIISPGEKPGGVVVDEVIAAIRLEARSDDCPSWRRPRFPRDVEPFTEREGAKGEENTGASTVEVVASDITASWSEW